MTVIGTPIIQSTADLMTRLLACGAETPAREKSSTSPFTCRLQRCRPTTGRTAQSAFDAIHGAKIWNKNLFLALLLQWLAMCRTLTE